MSNHDIVGLKFGALTVIERDYSYVSNKHTKWICKCDCGTVKSVFRNSLISGASQSCGCQRYRNRKGQNATHGMSNTRIFREWCYMIERCKPNSKNAKTYYERGITVCDEWKSDFMSFYNWAMQSGYSDNFSLDRIDNDKGYYPDNCQWIDIKLQQSHKSNTIFVNYKGKDYCLRTLCIKIGFPYKTAHKRCQRMMKKYGFIDTDKLFEPIHTEKISFRYRK